MSDTTKLCAECGVRPREMGEHGRPYKRCAECRAPRQRLCATCDTALPVQQMRGHPRRYCDGCNPVQGLRDAECVGCGKTMQTQTERPCCRPCGRRLTDDEKRALGLVARTPEHVCVQCGGTFVRRTHGPNRPAKFCSLKCVGKAQTAKGDPYKNQRNMSLKRARKIAAFVEVVDPAVLFERDGWRCHLCGKKCRRDVNGLHPDAPSIDHVVPLSKGGEHSYRNTACAHRRCNTAKGARPQGEQLALA